MESRSTVAGAGDIIYNDEILCHVHLCGAGHVHLGHHTRIFTRCDQLGKRSSRSVQPFLNTAV